MRSLVAVLPLMTLAACGGASGAQSVGSVAPPSGGTPTPSPTPTPTHFLDVSAETTFDSIGAFQSLRVTETGAGNSVGPLTYQGNASTVRTASGAVTYNPRDGIFTIDFNDTKAGVVQSVRFQDPAHRTEVGAWGVPTALLGAGTNFNQLEVAGPTQRPPSATDPEDLGRRDTITFFYQRPGTRTAHVSLAGYVRNAFEPTAIRNVFRAETETNFERGAMVFGTQTPRSQVPISGTASYSGDMLATMVVNTTLGGTPNYFQWITGTSELSLDFGKATVSMMLTGQASAATYAGVTLPPDATGVPAGSQFTATGAGTIDLTQTGGFTGRFSQASFANANGTVVPVYNSVNPGNTVAGANSIDGTFFGPNAVNVGGNFRIVGGVPDQRVDILGAFTAAKK